MLCLLPFIRVSEKYSISNAKFTHATISISTAPLLSYGGAVFV